MKIKFSARDAYAETTGSIRVMEKQFLSTQELVQLLELEDLADLMRILGQSGNLPVSGDTNFLDIEEILENEQTNTFQYFKNILPEPYVVELVELESIFLHMKIDAKNKPATFPTTPTNTLGVDFPEAAKNPRNIDVFLDTAYFKQVLDMANHLENEFIIDYFRKKIDIYNCLVFFRAKATNLAPAIVQKIYVDGGLYPVMKLSQFFNESIPALKTIFFHEYFGKAVGRGLDDYEITGHLGGLEKTLNNLLLEHLLQAKYIAYGPEIPFAYLLSKINEIKQIRLVLYGKNNDLDTQILAERIGDTYG